MTAIDPFADVRLPATTTPPPAREPSDQFGTDTFLKLLVAQLRFQNPLSPTDGTEFLAQTAQFTVVEKLIEIEKQAEESALTSRLLTATTMIGRVVTFTDPATGSEVSGTVTGVRVDPTTGTMLRVGEREVALTAITRVDVPTT